MRVLLDTNVLLRLTQTTHEVHSQVTQAVAKLIASNAETFIAPQSLYEYWVVATRPTAAPANGLGLSSAEATKELSRVWISGTLLDEKPEVYAQWRLLVSSLNIVGKPAHDARLAAFAPVWEIDAILTLNGRDFRRFPHLIVLDALKADEGF